LTLAVEIRKGWGGFGGYFYGYKQFGKLQNVEGMPNMEKT
jgi:hypothetical protein